MADENDDLDLEDLDLEDPDDEPEGEQEAPPKAKEKPAAKAKPAAPPAPDQAALAEFGLNALKASFVEAAKAAGHVAADFDGIGLKGIDEAAKTAFIAEAEASHKSKVEALAAQGFVYNPEAAGTAGKQAELDAKEAAQKAAWGPPGPGLPASGGEKFEATVKDEVAKGDTMGVIGSLMGDGGLGKFFVTGKRG